MRGFCHSSVFNVSFPLSCFFTSFCLFSFLILFSSHFLSPFLSYLLDLTFLPSFPPTPFLFILQRSSFIGRALWNQYEEIKPVSFSSSVIKAAALPHLCEFSVHAAAYSGAASTLKYPREGSCSCVWLHMRCSNRCIIILAARRQRGRSSKLIHQGCFISLAVQYVGPSRSCLHQHMQIPSALMSLDVYTTCDDWIKKLWFM